MKSRSRFPPPKQRLAQRSGRRMRPSSLPSGLKTATPSWPSPPPQPHQRLPSRSQRMPSGMPGAAFTKRRSEEHTSELQSQSNLVCRLLLEKKNKNDLEYQEVERK